MASFFRNQFPAAYEWPNQGGYSYSLPEISESGRLSNRVYVALYFNESNIGCIRIYIHHRAYETTPTLFIQIKETFGKRFLEKPDKSCEILVSSKADWDEIKMEFEKICPLILDGWYQKREQQTIKEFDESETSIDEKEEK